MSSDHPALYEKYYVDKADERTGLFDILSQNFKIESGLYPGSFIHITPSFVIPRMVYVDLDKRCESFFSKEETRSFVEKNKKYKEAASYSFYKKDYSEEIPEQKGSFDLLISLYAGFISKYCGYYLRRGGILVANNSHGDAPLAYMDGRFDLIGVMKRKGNKFSYSEKNLDSYFITRGNKPIDTDTILSTMKGPAYSRYSYAYVFRKNK